MTTLRDLIQQKLDIEGVEDMPEEVMRDTIEGLDGSLSEKVDAIVGLVTHWGHSEKVIAEEIKRLQKRKSVFASKAARLKDYLRFNLSRLNQPKVETELHTVALRKGRESVAIDDIDLLADDFIRVQEVPDKALITQMLKTGKAVRGAHLERGPDSLVIS